MSKERQTCRIGMRFTASERRMLETLSSVRGQTMATIVRQAIRREHEALRAKRAKAHR